MSSMLGAWRHKQAALDSPCKKQQHPALPTSPSKSGTGLPSPQRRTHSHSLSRHRSSAAVGSREHVSGAAGSHNGETGVQLHRRTPSCPSPLESLSVSTCGASVQLDVFHSRCLEQSESGSPVQTHQVPPDSCLHKAGSDDLHYTDRQLLAASPGSAALSEGQLELLQQRLAADNASGGSASRNSDSCPSHFPRMVPLSQAQLTSMRIIRDSDSEDDELPDNCSAGQSSSSSIPVRRLSFSQIPSPASPQQHTRSTAPAGLEHMVSTEAASGPLLAAPSAKLRAAAVVPLPPSPTGHARSAEMAGGHLPSASSPWHQTQPGRHSRHGTIVREQQQQHSPAHLPVEASTAPHSPTQSLPALSLSSLQSSAPAGQPLSPLSLLPSPASFADALSDAMCSPARSQSQSESQASGFHSAISAESLPFVVDPCSPAAPSTRCSPAGAQAAGLSPAASDDSWWGAHMGDRRLRHHGLVLPCQPSSPSQAAGPSPPAESSTLVVALSDSDAERATASGSPQPAPAGRPGLTQREQLASDDSPRPVGSGALMQRGSAPSEGPPGRMPFADGTRQPSSAGANDKASRAPSWHPTLRGAVTPSDIQRLQEQPADGSSLAADLEQCLLLDSSDGEADYHCMVGPSTVKRPSHKYVLASSSSENEDEDRRAPSGAPVAETPDWMLTYTAPRRAAPQPPPPPAPEPVTALPPSSRRPRAGKGTQTPRRRRQGEESATSLPEAVMTAAAFRRKRAALAAQLFAQYNSAVFKDRLPATLDISWNPKLTTTAGLTLYQRRADDTGELRYTAQVQLSSKVVDSWDKLRRTLLHELCHVAAWLLDHVAKPPHGPPFRMWAERAMSNYPDLEVTTCHAYPIHIPFQWQCINPACGQVYKRFSKSLDTTRRCCGRCRSHLAFLGKFAEDGTPARVRGPAPANSYSTFVQQNFARVRAAQRPGTPHRDVMRELANRWRERQSAAQLAPAAGGVCQ